MKKALVALLAIAMIASLSFAQDEVKSVNVVGFNKVTVDPGELALVTLNFETFESSTVANLLSGQFANGKIFIWDRSVDEYIGINPGRGGVWSATNIIYRGDGFWLKNNGSEAETVTLMGEVPYEYNDSQTTTVFNVSGIDAVGYAYPTDVAFTNTSLAVDPNVIKVFFWDEELQDYIGINPGRGGVWTTDYVIPAGRAFWVKTSGDIDWTEIAPYDL